MMKMMRKKPSGELSEEYPNAKPESEWKKELSNTEFRMLRQAGTEAPVRFKVHCRAFGFTA
jgi:hypothetical protein